MTGMLIFGICLALLATLVLWVLTCHYGPTAEELVVQEVRDAGQAVDDVYQAARIAMEEAVGQRKRTSVIRDWSL